MSVSSCVPILTFRVFISLAAAMNFLTSTFAVSLFPRATLVDFQAYTCGDGTVLERDWGVSPPTIRLNDGRKEEIPAEVTSQRRHVSDKNSWIVRYAQPDKFQPQYSCDEKFMLGLAFDVMDWWTYPIRSGHCIFIGKPFQLRQVWRFASIFFALIIVHNAV